MIVKERLYLTADRKHVVKGGDHKAAYLLAAKGQELPDKLAMQYGLIGGKQKKKPADKQIKMPENKEVNNNE
jgi:hypothetical protein